MRILAYLYSDPLLESSPDPALWGWEVDRVYQDFAVEGNARSQLQQLLNDCQTQPADYLLLRRLEELGDSVQAIGDRLSELKQLSIRVVTIDPVDTAGDSSENNPDVIADGHIRSDVLKLIQALQRNQRSQRIQQGHARNRMKAAPPPGRSPYGYRRSRNRYVVDRTTAPVVKEFFEQFLLFGSLRGAVRYIAKKYGKKISPSTGQRWLTNPVYRGDLEFKGGDVVADTHEAIVSREEAAQIDRLLRRNRRLPSRTASAPRSLAGLVQCQGCQSPMTVTRVVPPKVVRKNAKEVKEYLYLRPTACPLQPKCKAIAYETILQQAIERICEDLPRAVAALELPDLEQVQRGINGAIVGKQKIIEQLPGLIASGILDGETAQLREYKLRTEMAALQSRLAQLPPVNLPAIAQTVSLPQFWLDLSESERRFYFREFLRSIELVRDGKNWSIKLIFIF
ncbi:recombinase family protein [Alkalinema sp. FACHB-956]|uniref:recombinase family protein n=1 Tax=Alkalinema sp. FACHB-956 TaxID=2692768 RepID=UPI0016859FE5|nr:recombinase family protein [Alkalinema sp. FACHB-956]MBD2325824.1 recombinase family protein [Alkalinema sp. FACHB-956]